MPLVFVHGVNNRSEDADYRPGVDSKRGFLKSLLAPRIGLDRGKVTTFFPYWGGHGVRFRWKQASLPRPSEDVETLSLQPPGPGSGDFELWMAEARHQYGLSVSLGQISRDKGFEEAIDLIWDTASAVAPTSQDQGEIIDGYATSLRYAAKNPAPTWAMQVPPLKNDAFVQTLLKEIEAYRAPQPGGSQETLGLKDWFQALKESLSRLESAPSDVATALVLALGRQTVHEKASRFLGDIFVYLSERGTVDKPGPIVKDVLDDLIKAQSAKQAGDDKLVVVGHSLGGVIVYDIATYFKPDLKIDVFASIGSQVALFEEMTLYRASKVGLPPNPPNDRLAKPRSLGTWLNVYDTNDIFSFRAATVFDGPTDYRFDTGYGLLQAHGGYFARPSFYKRLAARLA